MERAMIHSTIAHLVRGATTALAACCFLQPVHAQVRLAAEKITSQQVDKALQNTRANIKNQRQTTPAPDGNVPSNLIVIDICKKNPQLPQCKR